jgi:hypothetical protein
MLLHLKLFANGQMPLRMADKETDDTPRSTATTVAMGECHMEQVKPVIERKGNISCRAVTTEAGISPASVYHILTNSLGKGNICTMRIEHMLDNDQRTTCVLITTIHLHCWRHEGNEFLDRILAVEKSQMHSFDPQLKC